MNLLSFIRRLNPVAMLRAFRNEASGTRNPAQWLIDWIRGGDEAHSGVTVNGKTAVTFAPVWQATNVLAGDVAQLPIVKLKRTTGNNKERDPQHPAFRLLMRRPNKYMNPGTFKQTIMYHALHWGNGYAEIQRDNRGRPIALTPLLPDRTEPFVDDAGLLWYVTELPSGAKRKLRAEHVLHIRGLGFDGLRGYSVITLARNSWGLGLAAEKYAGKFFKNNARPAAVLEHPKTLDEEATKRIRRSWNEIYEGLENVERIAILWEGMQYKPMSMSNRDSQWLEARQYQRTDVASWFNLPAHKVNDLARATFTNIEELNRDYLNRSLMGWLVTWQEECHEKLLTEAEKASDEHLFEFNVAALLRGDLVKRYQAYAIGIASRILNPNECRGYENLNSYEGGDEFINPNISQLDDAVKQSQQKDATPDAQQAVADRLAQIVGVEVQRVRTAGTKAKNFTGWIDSFYQRWPATIRDVLAELGADPLLADEHAERSAAELLDLLGRCTPAELPAALSNLLSTWPARADELAATILAERKALA